VGAFAKLAYLVNAKPLDLARFLLQSERSWKGGVARRPGATNAMKTILTLLIAGAFCVTGQASTNAVLSGIRIVETQDQLHPPRGKLGERGPYQFRRSTWRMHTSSSFELAENREVANTVAKRHYAWIEAQLLANGIASSPYNVALAWNAGVNAVIRGAIPAVAHDYATRVINIASALPDDAPQPSRALMLATAESPAQPEKPATPAAAPEPVPAPAPRFLVSTDFPGLTELIEVRYQTDPIMLAYSRSSTL